MTIDMIKPGMVLSTNGIHSPHPSDGVNRTFACRLLSIEPIPGASAGSPVRRWTLEALPGDHAGWRPAYGLYPFMDGTNEFVYVEGSR